MTTALLHLSSGWQCRIPLKLLLMRFLLPQKQNPPVRRWHWIYHQKNTNSACTQKDKCNFPSRWKHAHSSYVLMEWHCPWHKSQVVGTNPAMRHISFPHDSAEQHYSQGTHISKELKGTFSIPPLGKKKKMPKIKLSTQIQEGCYLFCLQNHLATSRIQGVPKLGHKLAEARARA